MICRQPHPVLLLSPHVEGQDIDTFEDQRESAWISIRPRSVADAMREVRYRRPSVLVLDVIGECSGGTGCGMMFRVMTEVRRRSPGTSIVVLGACDDPTMEQAARREGASVYLSVSGRQSRHDVQRIILAMHDQAGPQKANGPPASGVPPR